MDRGKGGSGVRRYESKPNEQWLSILFSDLNRLCVENIVAFKTDLHADGNACCPRQITMSIVKHIVQGPVRHELSHNESFTVQCRPEAKEPEQIRAVHALQCRAFSAKFLVSRGVVWRTVGVRIPCKHDLHGDLEPCAEVSIRARVNIPM